jgi:tryptophanyl-tRNA synthetase
MSKSFHRSQSTGTPRQEICLSFFIPAIEMSKNPDNQSVSFYFADLHHTQIKNGDELENTYSTCLAWKLHGLDVNKVTFT